MSELTHWKKLNNPDYDGAYNYQPGEVKVRVIKVVRKELVIGADGKKEECIVAHFNDADKPMILNATNCKMITKVTGTPYLEEWSGKAIAIKVEKVKAFGDVVEALRVQKNTPKVEQFDGKCSECGKPITSASGMTAKQIADYTTKKYGQMLCAECAAKKKESSNG